jgi:4'-phosphopantetheinyl transferase
MESCGACPSGNDSLADLSNSLELWSSPPDPPVLATEDVHVWRFSLDQSPTIVNAFRQLLAHDEQARADRFHFEVDRRHFIAARGCLRTILSRYLKTPPEKIRLGYNDHGKPELATSSAPTQLVHFNVTHSRGLALFAFTRLGEIGVDLEHISLDFAGVDIARRFFSSREVACLEKLPGEMQPRAFFNCWTRKEAFIKAKGVGLSLPLDQFDVTLAPAESAAILRTAWDENEAALWSLRTIDAGPAYAAAVALRAHDWRLCLWQVEEEPILRSEDR